MKTRRAPAQNWTSIAWIWRKNAVDFRAFYDDKERERFLALHDGGSRPSGWEPVNHPHDAFPRIKFLMFQDPRFTGKDNGVSFF